ncbi:MAG: AbgT family transporter [Phycisphaerales bacterium]
MTPSQRPRGLLGWIEWAGNKLPDPVMLFIGATILVMVVSTIGAALGWSVTPVRMQAQQTTVEDPSGTSRTVPLVRDGKPVIEMVREGTPITPRAIISRDGVYWLIANVVRNFINFAPLGVVLVSVMGIGVAERFGVFDAGMRAVAGVVPSKLVTPTVIFLGLLSHLAGDSGYVVLPALSGTLFALFGRPPIAGIAAAFAGVAGGFAANIAVSPTDALIAPITQTGAVILAPGYEVQPTCNMYFMWASSVMLPLVGWLVTARVVEPRARAMGMDAHAPVPVSARLAPAERRGLAWAGLAFVGVLGLVAALILVPGAPLYGAMPAKSPAFGPIPGAAVDGQDPVTTPRWSAAIVPLIFALFLAPGVVYGLFTGSVKKVSAVTEALVHSMRQMADVIVMCFFAAQFIECFGYSRLNLMVAYTGGEMLASAGLPTWVLLVALIVMTAVIDILIASMSAKWTALSPVIVPMMMMSGMSPELVQCAYRIGDSCANVLTPLNAYMVLILVAAQKYKKDFGLGSMVALMLPYAVVFLVAWTGLLLLWVWAGLKLGPNTPLWYVPAG